MKHIIVTLGLVLVALTTTTSAQKQTTTAAHWPTRAYRPAVVSDPAVPMITLPVKFKSYRINIDSDLKSVVYYYRIPRTKSPKVLVPSEWKINGLFECEKTFEEFQSTKYVGPAEDFSGVPTKGYPQIDETVETDHGWIDLQNYFFERHHAATPRAVIGHCAYARGTIETPVAREATLRVAIDDWAVVWVNGKNVATIDHPLAIEVKEIPIAIKKGANEILIKTNNTLIPQKRRLWVFNCAVISDGGTVR